MRILLVDDEVKFAVSLQKVLQSQRYAVDVIHDGQLGYEQAAVEPYDLILLDVNLPGLDGVKVCQKLRQEGLSTPILMLTAKDATSDKIDGLDSGADDYLVKPFEIEELLARIRSLLRRGKPESTILEIADLSLNPASQIVTRAGQEIELSAREYALLEFLMRHPGHIMSKQQILDHVWGNEVDSFSNVVYVYIGYLRNKIDKPFANGAAPLLTTVKGLGYRLGGVK